MNDRLVPPNNLPVPLTSFVGRARELSELLDLVSRTRLLTITGAGGCGKSRLAVQAATEALHDFPDGGWWVELAPVSDPELVAPTLAQVFGVLPQPGQGALEAVVSYLGRHRALLVIDNCEHLVEEAARVAEALARGCPQIRVFATSREPLRAEGETEWQAPPLSLPEPEAPEASDAVHLFVERAAQVKPGFALTPQSTPAVASICRELDGIPLAIELAAARLRAFSVGQIAEGLTERFRLLTGGRRTALPHHRTLRASVDWSYELLSKEERTVFGRLGVFVGGFTLESAERLCSGEGIAPGQVLGLLVALVEKSLVQTLEHGSVTRYRLLETVRQYALERLAEADETERLLDRHRDCYLELAERISPELLTPGQAESLQVLDPDAANFSLAIERGAATDPDKALRLVVALTLWWRMRSLFAQGEAGLARALDATTDASALRARALWGRAFLLTFAGKLEHSFLTAQQALDAAEELGDESTIARALWLVGIPMMWVDPEASRPGLERARDLAARAGDEFGLLHATQGLGMSYLLQDENHRARPLHEEARRLAERLGQQDALAWHWLAVAIAGWVSGDLGVLDEAARKSQSAARRAGDIVTEAGAIAAMGLGAADSGEPRRMFEELVAVRKRALAKGGGLIFFTLDLALALAHAADGRLEDARAGLERLIGHSAGGWMWMLMRAHTELAEVDRLRGDARLARREAEEGLELAGRIGDRPLAAAAQLVLGRLAAARGEWTEAQRLHHDVLPIAVEYGTPRVPRVLEALAEVAAGLQSHTEAARILGAAERRWTELGLLAWPHQRTEVEALAARVRQALGEEPYEQAFAEGRELTAEEAVAYVRRARGERKRPSAGWESLTPTELEVARYAASGLTNPEIAERMFISPGTVRTHLSHVFVKLGLRNRSELAREMTRRTGAASDD